MALLLILFFYEYSHYFLDSFIFKEDNLLIQRFTATEKTLTFPAMYLKLNIVINLQKR